MIQRTKQLISHDLIQDEEYRHFCRESYFQREDNYETLRMIGAARNEFMLIQVAKVNTDCNFQLIAESTSNDELIVHNIFPTDHLNQNIIILVNYMFLYKHKLFDFYYSTNENFIACSKLLRQEKFFRVWYHPSGVLRKKPRDETEGLKYVEIIPEPKCKYTTGKTAVNRSAAFVHFTMLRMRLPVRFQQFI
uniref:Uncharacterized protein n=1 Tax=Onchocerca volvulus TaxID=6282 RepID=A0A8R1U095_ONCVO